MRRCLSKDVSKRVQSALDIRNELSELRRELESGELLGSSQPIRKTRLTSTNVGLLIVAAAGLLLLVGVGLLRSTKPSAGHRASRREPGPSHVRCRSRESSDVVAGWWTHRVRLGPERQRGYLGGTADRRTCSQPHRRSQRTRHRAGLVARRKSDRVCVGPRRRGHLCDPCDRRAGDPDVATCICRCAGICQSSVVDGRGRACVRRGVSRRRRSSKS